MYDWLNIETKFTKKITKSCIDKTKKDELCEKFVIKKDFVGFDIKSPLYTVDSPYLCQFQTINCLHKDKFLLARSGIFE